ncbi:hypothetical protein E2320_022704, partial [Naja naja]
MAPGLKGPYSKAGGGEAIESTTAQKVSFRERERAAKRELPLQRSNPRVVTEEWDGFYGRGAKRCNDVTAQ